MRYVLSLKKLLNMGCIVKLDKMPEHCRVCPFSKNQFNVQGYCRLRDSRIIAYKNRTTRLPLCPLINEGEYLSKVEI